MLPARFGYTWNKPVIRQFPKNKAGNLKLTQEGTGTACQLTTISEA